MTFVCRLLPLVQDVNIEGKREELLPEATLRPLSSKPKNIKYPTAVTPQRPQNHGHTINIPIDLPTTPLRENIQSFPLFPVQSALPNKSEPFLTRYASLKQPALPNPSRLYVHIPRFQTQHPPLPVYLSLYGALKIGCWNVLGGGAPPPSRPARLGTPRR